MSSFFRSKVPALLLGLSVLIFSVGCEPEDSTAKPKADPDPAPKMSLKESLTKVSSLVAKMQEGVAGGEADKIDGPLHDIGHVLGDLPSMIKDSALADEAKSELADAVKSLTDGTDKIHDLMHGSAISKEQIDTTYASVKDGIEAALKTIKSVADSL